MQNWGKSNHKVLPLKHREGKLPLQVTGRIGKDNITRKAVASAAGTNAPPLIKDKISYGEIDYPILITATQITQIWHDMLGALRDGERLKFSGTLTIIQAVIKTLL